MEACNSLTVMFDLKNLTRKQNLKKEGMQNNQKCNWMNKTNKK